MINIRGISKTFHKGSPNEIRIFDNFSLEINKKDFIIIVGSNGSGKSSLLNIIAGGFRPDKGAIFLEGKEISTSRDFERSSWLARIFQNPLNGTASELTILENFRLASLRTSRKKLKIGTNEKFKSIVKERLAILNLGLENKLDLEIGRLSGGQRQALALIMAIMDETKVLLLDEPTAALDPRTSELIMRLTDTVIKEYDLTALLVTHQIKDVISFGNRIIQMKEGQIVRDFRKEKTDALKMSAVYEWFSE